MSAEKWIEQLKLEPHPEGGYFKEVYRSEESISISALPKRYKSDHSFGTSIYFLLKQNQVSKFHKIQSDEIWHFYEGSPIILYLLQDGEGDIIRIELSENRSQGPQVIIPRGCWFSAELKDKASYALVGCTVSPGFEFEDFEMANTDELIQAFPHHSELIQRFQ